MEYNIIVSYLSVLNIIMEPVEIIANLVKEWRVHMKEYQEKATKISTEIAAVISNSEDGILEIVPQLGL